MNGVKVQYTVKQEYVETNKANIQQVMADLKKINNPDIQYSAFLLDDGQTFVHFVMRARNNVNGDHFADLVCGHRTGIGRGLHRADFAANDG